MVTEGTQMKLTKFATLLMIGLALSFAATGCKSKKPTTTPLPGANGPGITGPGSAGEGGKIAGGESVDARPGGGEAATFNPDDFNQDRAALAAQTVYFDFD